MSGCHKHPDIEFETDAIPMCSDCLVARLVESQKTFGKLNTQLGALGRENDTLRARLAEVEQELELSRLNYVGATRELKTACRCLSTAERDRDEWKAGCERAMNLATKTTEERDEWKARAQALEVVNKSLESAFDEALGKKERVSISCPDGREGCAVRHFKWRTFEEHALEAGYAKPDTVRLAVEALEGLTTGSGVVPYESRVIGEKALAALRKGGGKVSETCRSCGAAIFWAETESGKAMPVDVVPVDEGNLEIQLPMDPREPLIARVVSVGHRYKSHFATCPQASKWRTK